MITEVAILLIVIIVSAVTSYLRAGRAMVIPPAALLFYFAYVTASSPPVSLASLFAALSLAFALDFLGRPSTLRGLEFMLVAGLPVALGIAVLAHDVPLLLAVLVLATMVAYGLLAMGGDPNNLEASVKYIVFSGSGKAVAIAGIGLAVAGSPILGGVLIVIGFALEIGVFPFHGWVPDAFTVGDTRGLAVLASVGKFVAIVIFIKLLSALSIGGREVAALLVALGVLGSIYGSVAGLTTRYVGKVLAYSSIAHMAYSFMALGIGLLRSDLLPLAMAVALYEALATAIAKYGLFSALEDAAANLQSLKVSRLAKAGGALLTLSLLGLPPLVGFFPKLFLILLAMWAGLPWLAIIVVVTSAVAAIYYIRLLTSLINAELGGSRGDVGTSLASILSLALGIGFPIVLSLLSSVI